MPILSLEEQLEKAQHKIEQLDKLVEDCIALMDKQRAIIEQADKMFEKAKQFAADFGTYINEEDWDLPDQSDLLRAIDNYKRTKRKADKNANHTKHIEQ